MKKNEILESIRSEIPASVRRDIDLSFQIVDRIHVILNSQGKSQRDLAKLLEKSETEISRWMRGSNNFTIKTIRKIEDALGENIISVVSDPTPKQENHIVMTFNKSATTSALNCPQKTLDRTKKL